MLNILLFLGVTLSLFGPGELVPLLQKQQSAKAFWPAYNITQEEFQTANGSTLLGWKKEWEDLQMSEVPYSMLDATAALMELRDLVLEDPDGLTANWEPSQHPCQFSSVLCNHHGVVVGVDFSSLSWHKQAEPLGRVQNVKPVVRLKKLPNGPAWNRLGHMSLRTMRFSNIRLDIPKLPDWSDYKQLNELALGNLGLEGTLPPSFASLGTLKHLDLHNNRFGGSLPSSWSNMSNLRFLDVSLDAPERSPKLVSVLPPAWRDLKKLQVLELSNQNVHGPLPGAWANMPALEVISLANTRVSGQLPPVWSVMRNLTTLDLSGTLLTGDLPPAWGEMRNLSSLDLRGTGVSASLPQKWTGLCKGNRSWEGVPFYTHLPQQGSMIASILEDGQINLCRPNTHKFWFVCLCIVAVALIVCATLCWRTFPTSFARQKSSFKDV